MMALILTNHEFHTSRAAKMTANEEQNSDESLNPKFYLIVFR